MPTPSPKIHELIRDLLAPEALSRGRKIYLSSAVREVRIDLRRRRYSAIVDDGLHGAVTVRIEHGKDGPTWVCSLDGKSSPGCAHVAALLTAIREREASESDAYLVPGATGAADAIGRVSLVDHLLENAERDHLIQAFRLCLRTYPELQGDLVFTILENIDADGDFYDTVVQLMDDPEASRKYILPPDGFDPYRLLDEINYLYEQERYQQCFLLSRAILARLLGKMAAGKKLQDFEVDLTISSSGLLSDLALPPAPEHLAAQVHELGMKLLKKYPKVEPQIQSSLVALINDESLGQGELDDLEQTLRRRWERARAAGRKARHVAEAEQMAMPLALFYARTRQFDKLQALFDLHLQNPLLRAPALAEMLQHDLHEVVLGYVDAALIVPPASTSADDPEDMARCAMYNDLVIMLIDQMDDDDGDDAAKEALLVKAFRSIGHRVYTILEFLQQAAGEEGYRAHLVQLETELRAPSKRGTYTAVTKHFVVLCELGYYGQAYTVHQRARVIDPVVLLDYLPNFLPDYQRDMFQPALEAVIELLPMVADEGLSDLVRTSITRLWNVNDEVVRQALEKHFVQIADDNLADFVDGLLGDFDPDELGL